jgi:hypothetical protein
LKLLSTYERIKAADIRCKEIAHELYELPAMEYCAESQRQQTRGLNQEYLWSAQFIINQCQYVIDSDRWSDDIDFQIQMSNFQKHYEDKLKKINNHSDIV